jgi:hypothetical protein
VDEITSFIMKIMMHDVDICDDRGIFITFHHVNDGYKVIMYRPDIIGIDDV